MNRYNDVSSADPGIALPTIDGNTPNVDWKATRVMHMQGDTLADAPSGSDDYTAVMQYLARGGLVRPRYLTNGGYTPQRMSGNSFGLPMMQPAKPAMQPNGDRVINSFDSNGNKTYYAHGGVVGMHPGQPRGTDTVPAWLTPGEAVLTPQATQAIGGKPAVDTLNSIGKGGLYAAAQQRGLPPVRSR